MSGDLRAKKNTRLFNKAGGNKKENSKKALDLQTSGVDEEYRDEDFNEDAITNTKDAYEGIEDDRIITTKVILYQSLPFRVWEHRAILCN